MKVLLVTVSYPPMLNSAARLFSELAQGLALRGHDVTVLTSLPDRYLATDRAPSVHRVYLRQCTNSVQVHRVAGLPVPRRMPLFRGLEHLFLAGEYLLAGLLLGSKEAVIVCSPPLPLGMACYLLARLWHGRVILNVQDLYPQTAIDLGLLRSRPLIAIARWMERFLYCHADAITVHSEGNQEYIIEQGATPERVQTVFNWVDPESLRPGQRANGFRVAQGISDGTFVVSYAGVMGFAQGLEDVVGAAAELREYPDILFLLAGDGVMRQKLQQRIHELGLRNVWFLPIQPADEYAQLLAASDACLVTLHPNLATPVVPGKLQSIMAAGRPAVCSTNARSDTVRILRDAGCGLWVEAGRPSDLAQAVLTLYQDRALAEAMGCRGRAYAEQHFDRDRCVSRYEELLIGSR